MNLHQILLSLVILALCNTTLAKGVVEIDYDANTIVPVEASQGFAVHIALDPSEQIESVAVGDSKHWVVVAKDGAHDVYLKPQDGAKSSNLLVRTNERSYSFALHVIQGSPTYLVAFRYPESTTLQPLAPSPIDRNYSMQVGPDSESIRPVAAYDDDHYTYLAFAPHAEMPAVFEVLPDRSEQLLNFHVQNGTLVVHAVVRRLVLRLGTSVVSVFHDSAPLATSVPAPVTVNRATRRDRNSSPAP